MAGMAGMAEMAEMAGRVELAWVQPPQPTSSSENPKNAALKKDVCTQDADRVACMSSLLQKVDEGDFTRQLWRKYGDKKGRLGKSVASRVARLPDNQGPRDPFCPYRLSIALSIARSTAEKLSPYEP